MKPIFLISLPRAGSTLVQRILMSHPEIASKSEPWIMLPLMYMLKPEGMVSEYSHRDALIATQNFIEAMPNKEQDYYDALREFVLTIYAKHIRRGEQYFLDKTPRYYLIIEELARLFPEGKFIFLVRSPLQVAASIISTFSLKHFHFYHIDLFKGLNKIAAGIELLGNRAIVIKYEDMVSDQDTTLAQIFTYLELSWDSEIVDELDSQGLTGVMGDKVGIRSYRKVENKSIDKWKSTLRERTRRNFVLSVIKSMDQRTLGVYGYDKVHLLNELKEITTKTTLRGIRDAKYIVTSKLIRMFYLNLYRHRVKQWSEEVILS